MANERERQLGEIPLGASIQMLATRDGAGFAVDFTFLDPESEIETTIRAHLDRDGAGHLLSLLSDFHRQFGFLIPKGRTETDVLQ